VLQSMTWWNIEGIEPRGMPVAYAMLSCPETMAGREMIEGDRPRHEELAEWSKYSLRVCEREQMVSLSFTQRLGMRHGLIGGFKLEGSTIRSHSALLGWCSPRC